MKKTFFIGVLGFFSILLAQSSLQVPGLAGTGTRYGTWSSSGKAIALTLGSANQISGVNAAGTGIENKAVTVTSAGAVGGITTLTAQRIISTAVSGNTTPSFIASSGSPRFEFDRSDAAANNRYWRISAGTSTLVFNTRSDAGVGGTNFLSITRATAAITDVSIGNATDNNTVQFLGTGAVSFAGTINLATVLISKTAPTISSGFGTSPSIASDNGTAAFTVNVGTGGAASTGVIGLPTATTGWICTCADITTFSVTVFLCRQTATSTTTATIGQFSNAAVARAWAASDIVRVSCFAY